MASGGAGMNSVKAELAERSNPRRLSGGEAEALADATVFIGLSCAKLPEELLGTMAPEPMVFALSLHGFIVGQPFRLRPLRKAIKHCVEHKHADRVWFTRAGDIANYCFGMKPGIIPGS